ncbi:MAG: diacylglycerol kinase family protein [bacterium]
MVGEKILLIVNQVSGLGEGRKCEEWLRRMSLEVHDKRIEIICSSQNGNNSIENLAKKAKKKGYSRIIVAGGDGTVHKCVNGLAKGQIPLGIIPLGTGNDFSKGNGIPQEREKAFWVAVYGKEVSVDLGMVDGILFVNVVSFGFDAQIVRMIPELKKNLSFLPKKGLYLIALLKKLFLSMDFPEIMINNQKGERVLGLVVTNGPHYGGGKFKIAPKASFTDGLLDVCLIGEMDKLRLVKNLYKILNGTHDSLSEVKMGRMSSLVVSSFENLACEIDGEIFDSKREYIITVHPKALRLIVPWESRAT